MRRNFVLIERHPAGTQVYALVTPRAPPLVPGWGLVAPPYRIPSPIPPIPVITTIGDLTLIANQELTHFGVHDIYSSRITNIYLILPGPVEGYPEMTFERPDGSTFTTRFPYVSVGQFTVNTPKGLAVAGHYLVYNVVKSVFYYPGVWRAFAKGDGEGASFYVRTY